MPANIWTRQNKWVKPWWNDAIFQGNNRYLFMFCFPAPTAVVSGKVIFPSNAAISFSVSLQPMYVVRLYEKKQKFALSYARVSCIFLNPQLKCLSTAHASMHPCLISAAG